MTDNGLILSYGGWHPGRGKGSVGPSLPFPSLPYKIVSNFSWTIIPSPPLTLLGYPNFFFFLYYIYTITHNSSPQGNIGPYLF